jgi:protein-S-isoprenylcysteine O-methyltransferase Ste14
MTQRQKGRIFVLIQFVLIIAIVASSFYEKKYFNRPNSYLTDFLAFLFLSAGFLLMIISFMNFGQKITANPVPGKDTVLRTTGMYSKVRHPIYLSVLLLMPGCIFFSAAYYTFLIYAVMIVFFIVKIDFEEKQLEEKFSEYKTYKNGTNRLLPYIY